jgi:RNA-directed DNA polymerase
LRNGCDTWILDADIKGAFDNLSHEFILSAIGQVPGRELIKQWLRAGYVEAEIFHATTKGTPQGGTISPLLANIALDGMEKLLRSYTKVTIHQPSPQAKQQKPYKKKSGTYGFIRYADDFLVTAKTQEDIEAILPTLKEWLQQRGLELNPDKTNIVPVEQGCNFLGFTIRQFKGKCLITPQFQKVQAFLQSIRDWLRNNPQVKTEAVINHLNPILRGWGNYYKHGVSKRVFSYVDSQIWKAIWRWCKRRHPNKGSKWIARKYFSTFKGRAWTFSAQIYDRTGTRKTLALIRLADIPIERHIKVKGTASPDDSQLASYWKKRQTRYGKTYWEKGSKLYQVAASQNWQCPVCGEPLFNGEQLHTHHLVRVAEGGTNFEENLTHLHKACHQHLHSGRGSELQEA